MLNIRKIGALGKTYRHLNRYRQILTVLVKYGFDDLVNRLKIDEYLEVGLQVFTRKQGEGAQKYSRSERVRLAIEDLGPTFVKLGQILSTRPDLVPVEFVEEFVKLQDQVPSFPFSDVVEILDRELGRSHMEVFDSLDPVPLASASIGQVHKGVLKTGEQVAVKVRRPDIKRIIEIDLEILLHMATLMERHIEDMDIYRPVRVVEEFTRTLEREIDFNYESEHMSRVGRQFLDDPTVYIPYVHQEFSGQRVLVMEYVEAIKISDIGKIDAAGLDRKKIVARGANLILRQVFTFGFFHADPHPGNLAVMPHNVICLFDFGMVGSVDRQTRELFVDLVDAVVNQNPPKVVQVLVALTDWDQEPDTRRLEAEASDFLSRYLYKSLKEIHVGQLLQDLVEILGKYRLRLPPDLFLMIKALATVEGVGLALDPDFDIIEKARPFVRDLKLARFHPKRIGKDLLGLSTDLYRFMQMFPSESLSLMRQLRQEQFTVGMRIREMESMMDTLAQVSNRLAFAIIIAALIMGSAMIVKSEIPPRVFGVSLLGFIGFVGAGVMGTWLLIAILRKGRL